MRHIKTKIVQTILLAGISLFTFCTSALADIDWKRMKRDLSIQESILDQFLDTEKGSTTGLYVKNYGVLFIANGWKQTFGKKGSIKIVMLNKGEYSASVPSWNKKEEEALNTKRITEFLSTYANAIGQLKDDDRVTILLHASKLDVAVSDSIQKPAYSMPENEIDSLSMKVVMHNVREKMMSVIMDTQKKLAQILQTAGPMGIFFEATVTKRDIDAYNRGKIDEQTFQKRITFREHEPQPSRDKKIGIMADILSSVFKREQGQNIDLHFLNGTQSEGFYQKGIGALFLISQKGNLFGYDWDKQESDQDDGLDAFKNSVIETLADYGSTLRDISPEESIIVHANLIKDSDHKIMRIVRIKKDKTPEIIQHPDRILFRVAKRDIDAYASQKIDLDTFRKRVTITEM